MQLMRQYEQSPVSYDADALEFQHARDIKQRQKVKRRSSLKTYKVRRPSAFCRICCHFFSQFSVKFLIRRTWDPTSSSLRITTDRCFRYASTCLWNRLTSSLHQPHFSPSVSVLPVHAPTTSSHSLNSPLSPSITPSLFHSRLKTYLFYKSFPP